MEVCGQLHPAAALTPGKEAAVVIRYEARQTPELVWRSGEEKKFLLLPEIEPLSSSPQPVTMCAGWAIPAHSVCTA
jgi:hypothetical protein